MEVACIFTSAQQHHHPTPNGPKSEGLTQEHPLGSGEPTRTELPPMFRSTQKGGTTIITHPLGSGEPRATKLWPIYSRYFRMIQLTTTDIWMRMTSPVKPATAKGSTVARFQQSLAASTTSIGVRRHLGPHYDRKIRVCQSQDPGQFEFQSSRSPGQGDRRRRRTEHLSTNPGGDGASKNWTIMAFSGHSGATSMMSQRCP